MLCLLLDELENIKPVWKSPRGDWGNLCIHMIPPMHCFTTFWRSNTLLISSLFSLSNLHCLVHQSIHLQLPHAGRTEHKLWIKTALYVLPVPECSIWLMKNTQLLWQMFKFITSDIKLTLNYPATYSISLMTLLWDRSLSPALYWTKLVVNLDSKQR